MSAPGTEPTVAAGNDGSVQSRRGWLLLVAAVLLLLVIVVMGSELWGSSPTWLHGIQQVVVHALHWVRVHWLNSGALAAFATVFAALVVYVLQRRADRRRDRREQARLDETARAKQAEQDQAEKMARAALLAATCWVDEETGWLPRVSEATNPIILGVHPAADLGDLGSAVDERLVKLPVGVPVYVPRDKEAELESKLARGGLVLVVGDSTAGKSRAAYEAIHRLFGQRFLLVPNARGSLQALLDGGIELRETVVWLNDLERWLGPGGLDLGLLRRLLGDGRRQVVVMATMRSSEYAAHSPEQGPGRSDTDVDLRRAEHEVLDQAARVELDRRFTHSERVRAGQRAWDPRIADALAHAGTSGLAEYLAAGPRLWRRWRDGSAVDNPSERLAGAAIVAVAVDCRRAGLAQPVPEGLLRDLFLGYLDAPVARRLGSDAFTVGLKWATKPIQATSALLAQDRHGYMAFDYLVDRMQADAGAPPVPDATWTRLLRYVRGDDALTVGFGALIAGRRRFAEQAWRKAADAGDHNAEYNLGLLLIAQGRIDDGEQWYRKAADAGQHNAEAGLGTLLATHDRMKEAEQWLRKAADAGTHSAEAGLGLLLLAQGRIDAESWLRKAAIGDNGAAAAWAQRALHDIWQ